MWGCCKFSYKALNQTVPSRIAQNQTMQSHAKAYIARFSCYRQKREQSMTKLDWLFLGGKGDFAHHLIF